MTEKNKPGNTYKVMHAAQTNHTVRVGPMEGIPAVVRSLGYLPETIFASIGFKMAQFKDPDLRVSYLAASKLLAHCAAATQCQHFGLLVGKRSVPSHLGIAGYLLRTAPDVGTALHNLVKYLDLHDQGGIPMFTTSGNRTMLGYAINLHGVEAADQISDLSVAIACNILRTLCGAKWSPTEILLMRRPPLDVTPYKRFFQAPLRFNADESAVVFPTRWLNHQLPSADPMLQHHLEMEANALHALKESDLIGDLHKLLRQNLTLRLCSATVIARQLGIHERTLNRQLAAKGTSFRHELEQVRYLVSKQLLTSTTAALAEIATSLGYADASAFSRAFKRWSGIAPGIWRVQGAVTEEETIRIYRKA